MKAPIAILALLALLLAGCGGGSGGGSPSYPRLSGRVVDTANLLDPAQEAALTGKLEALQRASSRQLVVVTVPDLGGRPIEDYGVGLGRAWRIGQSAANNGTLLIVSVAEKKIRIEVGYGLEGILTDALTSRIIRERITPRFQANDYAGGITAGADAIIAQLQAPREAAEQNVAEASRTQGGEGRRGGGGSLFGLIIWSAVLLFVLLGLLGRGLFGRRYGRRYGRRVSVWGPGDRGGGSGLGWMIFGMVLGNLSGRGGRGSGWGGGWGGGSGGGGGGFSGGGGSFGGGGASGGW